MVCYIKKHIKAVWSPQITLNAHFHAYLLLCIDILKATRTVIYLS